MELRFSNHLQLNIENPSHKAVQKIMGEVDIREMKSQLECEKYSETSDNLGKGTVADSCFMSWERFFVEKKKKKKNSIGRLGIAHALKESESDAAGGDLQESRGAVYKGGLTLATWRRTEKMNRVSKELLLTEGTVGLEVVGVALPSLYP